MTVPQRITSDLCDCDEGRIWNNADPTSGQWHPCEKCESGLKAQNKEILELIPTDDAPIQPKEQ